MINSRQKTDSVFFNTKVKQYPDGSTNSVSCNKKIFRNKDFEETYNFFSNQRELEIYKNQQKLQKIFRDYRFEWEIITFDGVPKKILKKYNLDFIFKCETEKAEKKVRTRSDSLKRAKDKIFDIVYMNIDFKYFLTITIDPEKIDSLEPSEVIKTLSQWLSNQVKRKGLKYVLVPELHKKSGRVHCHALVNDVFDFVPSDTRCVPGFKKPLKVSTIKSKGLDPNDYKVVYNVPEWGYGYSTAIECYGLRSKLAFYMTKYITKELSKIFGKFYLSSRNIQRTPKIVLENRFFSDDREVVQPFGCPLQYQYNSDFKFSSPASADMQTALKNSQSIIDVLAENNLL